MELDGDATHNPVSIMAVVDLMDKYDIGYGAVNHARSRCLIVDLKMQIRT